MPLGNDDSRNLARSSGAVASQVTDCDIVQIRPGNQAAELEVGCEEAESTSKEACQDSCCGGSTVDLGPTNDSDDAPTDLPPVCTDFCCDGEATPDIHESPSGVAEEEQDEASTKESADDCCRPSPPACSLGCCDKQEPVPAEEGIVHTPDKDCSDNCCSAKSDPKSPECCRGKPAPCCDESCLDRLALRECDSTAGPACAEQKHQPCDQHRLSIRQQYRARLDALGCICRALLALGKETCCDPRWSSTPVKPKACNRSRSPKEADRISISSCYSSSMAKRQSTCKRRPARHQSKASCCPPSPTQSVRSDGSCCKPITELASKSSLFFNPEEQSGVGIEAVGSRTKACGNRLPAADMKLVQHQGDASTTMSKEISARNNDIEHVVLSVSGMTCTGCETKLNRTLGVISGVKNLKTSLVLSRAEFDIDLNIVTCDYVMKHLERRTEFKCEILTNDGFTLDLVINEDPAMFVNQSFPDGVLDITLVKKDVARVSFDPLIIGSRDLMERHWKGRATLAPGSDDPGLAAGRKHVSYLGYMTILSIALTIPVLVLAWAPLPKREVAYSSASLVLATIVQVVIAGPFYPKALKALLFSRVIEMDLLIVLSTSAAYVFSVVSFGYLAAEKPLPTGQFFETSTLLVTLIMVGRYVAALARQKAVESISMRTLQAETALLVANGDTSKTETVDVRLLQYGDTFKVLPETRIPTDGVVLAGSSEVDESMLTGESLPVEKTAKSSVIAGTLNGPGTLIVRLKRLPGDNTIATIAAMVDQAKLSKPKMQELADKVASYFVPVVVGLTIITFVIWVAVGIAIQHKSGSGAAVQAITYAITVLIVSCPCAVGLAVPMVIVIASGIAAERGVIFKSANAIEIAHQTTHLVLDKTGTLTEGKLSVTAENIISDNQNLSLLLGLIADNKHPVSIAIANHLRNKHIVATPVRDVKSLVGKGVTGLAGDKTLRAGNSRWLDFDSHPAVRAVDAQEHTVFCFSIDGRLAAVFGLKDSLRPDALHVVGLLQQQGISVHIVSGDDNGPVQGVASKLGIPTSHTRSRSTPADKQLYIKRLLEETTETKKPVVVFCGDGTNDSVALAQATIGVHMHEGSDVAQSAADVVLMRPGLTGLVTVREVSKASVRRIKFNFAWAFVYNTFAVLLAAGAFVNARIPPEYAGLGELVSVLPVIAAAVLMRWSKV